MDVIKINAIPTISTLFLLALMLAMPQCEKMERFGDGIPQGDRILDAELKAAELTTAEEEAILFMLEEEKLALEVYTSFLDLYEPPLFDNLVASEDRHMKAVLNLIECFGIEEPVLEDGVFTDPLLQEMFDRMTDPENQGWEQALLAGEEIELADIEDLTYYLDEKVAVHENVILVFSNLLAASVRHLAVIQEHLEAFSE